MKDKIIAAICHGPPMLIEAEVIGGRKATSWSSVRTDLKNAQAKVVDAAVVVGDKIVTSRSPDDLPDFCKTIQYQLSTSQNDSRNQNGMFWGVDINRRKS